MQYAESQIRKEVVTLKTYPFSDPSPVAAFGRIYPYARFDGYAVKGCDMEWEMVVMENDFVKLWINPQTGGKIWGAIEKSTGKEFIYFNHVAKFRDVAMRGPWTSGGIETNMGIIGHTPSGSTPVDYAIRTNPDGSVSCFIAATDWPSRTTWRMELCLPKDTAYFKTRTWWFNNTNIEQAYYQWSNAGIKTSGNLEYIFPGSKRIAHDGTVLQWPVDEKGKHISQYDQNNFGEYKSYHVFGSITDFWGCYWHDDDFGMGHYADYYNKPGKKIWIWGLSRFGMIWQDLLTDNDGQYTEVQSGRMFSQSIAPSSQTPFKHRSFAPYSFDGWDEYWFPVKQTRGITYACPQLSFNLLKTPNGYELIVCANQPVDNLLVITGGSMPAFSQQIKLAATENLTLDIPPGFNIKNLRVLLDDVVVYDAEKVNKPLKRPATMPQAFTFDSTQALYMQAKEWERQRFYSRALDSYNACLGNDAFFIAALNGKAMLLYRLLQYNEALDLVSISLSVDTYDAEANYLYGLINLRLSNDIDAEDGLSIAALSPAYRDAAFTEMAKLYIRQKQWTKAGECVQQALQSNTKNQVAKHLQLIGLRYSNQFEKAVECAQSMTANDPLDHTTNFELCMLGRLAIDEFAAAITSEMPHETFIEIAAFYAGINLYNEALKILEVSPTSAMVNLWNAHLEYLRGNSSQSAQWLSEAIASDPLLVFPHRAEEVGILEWATGNNPHWKLRYYLGLTYCQFLKKEEALALMESCGQTPDFYPFYLLKASLKKELKKNGVAEDIEFAYSIAPQAWRTCLSLAKYYGEENNWQIALDTIEKGYNNDRKNYYLGLFFATCLLQTGRYDQGIQTLKNLVVLPNEGAMDGRITWREMHLQAAIYALNKNNCSKAANHISDARLWPENLGVGKPYDTDERLENFLQLFCWQQLNNAGKNALVNKIAFFRNTTPGFTSGDTLTILVLRAVNEFDKADKILQAWKQHNSNDIVYRWTVAFIEDNITALTILTNEPIIKREALPYEIIVEDRDFAFVKKLYLSGILKNVLTALAITTFHNQF